MPSITVQCTHCRSRLKLKDRSRLGRRLGCPKCGKPFVVQAPDTDNAITVSLNDIGDDAAPPLPRRTRSGKKRSRKKSSRGSTKRALLIGLGVTAILGLTLVIGVGLWIYNAVTAGVDQLEQMAEETEFEQLVDGAVTELEAAGREQMRNSLASNAPQGFASPQAAFDAMSDALAAGDWRRATGCMTDESQEMMAGGLLLIGGLVSAFGGEESAGLTAVMQRHGIDPEEGPDIDENGAFDLPIRDKPQFIADMLAAMEATGENIDEGPIAWAESSELADLVMDGDTATATVVSMTEDGEEREPIEFRRSDGAWLVHLPKEAFQMGGGPTEIVVTAESDPQRNDSGPVGPEMFIENPDGPLPEESLTTEEASEAGLRISLRLTREEPFEVFGIFPDDAVFAILSFRGPLITSSFEYGKFAFTAVDDTGRELTLAEPIHATFGGDPSKEFIELDHFFLDRPDELFLAMGLTSPARGATAMTSFSGSLQLKTRTTVVIENVRDRIGQTLDNEDLRAGGPFQIVAPTREDGDADSTVVVVCRGEGRQQHEVGLVDVDGQDFHTAVWRYHHDRESRYVLESTQPLPREVGLKITLAGSARVLTIPFDFRDVALNEGTATMSPEAADQPGGQPSAAATDEDGFRVIPGTFSWDLETDRIGDDDGSFDLTWRYRSETERGLVALNGGALLRIVDREFDEIDRAWLESADYSRIIVPGSTNNNRLAAGTVLGLRTAEGNFAKLRVKDYVASHDFTFAGASVLTDEWKDLARQKPNRSDYHLELEWVLYD